MPSRFHCLLLLCFLAILGANQSQAAEDVFPLKIHEKELSNGLKVFVVPTGFPNIISLQIPVQTGSRNEVEEGKTGFAHFFEHMMFRGTKNVPPDVYQNHLRKMGARQNAYTSQDYTNYHTTFAKDDLELMLQLEADRFMNLSYGLSEFKTEARAVLGEYNKNSANPGSKLAEVTRNAAFKKHTYKHTVMGFIKDIEMMPEQYEYAKTFFDRWYRPEYTSLIVAGDVDPEKAFALVEKYFGAWQRGSYTVKIPVEPAADGPVYTHLPWDSETVPLLAIGFHGPAFAPDSRAYAAIELLFKLAFGETSELYKRLVLNEQKVTSLWAMASDAKDPDLYSLRATLKDPKDIAAVRDAILTAAQRFVLEPPSQAALDAARSHQRYSLGQYLDNTDSIAELLAAFVHYERRADTLNRLYSTAATVTPEDIQKAAAELFTDKRLVVSTLAKGELPAAIKKTPRLSSLVPAAASAENLPPLLKQSNEIPFLDIKIQFTQGSAADPQGKEGLAQLAGSMISEAGTRALRYEELQKALYPYAAGFSQRIDKEQSTFTIKVHRDQAPAVLELLLPAFLEPGLREEDFQRLKAQQLNELKIGLRTNNEEELGKERLQELIFSGSRYAHPVLGTVAGIEAISIEDIRAFMNRIYTRKNLRLGVNGDLPESLGLQLQKALAALPAGAAQPNPKLPLAPALKERRVDIIQKPTRATAISFGHPIEVTRSHPDFAALWLARAWLGEHRSSMSYLYERIREVRGLNYGDYAYIEAFPGGMYNFYPPSNVARRQQIFEIWLRPVKPEHAPMALRIALHELQNLLDKGLSPEQFTQTRDYLMKNVYLMTASQDQQLGYALDAQWYGLGPYADTLRSQLAALTPEAVHRALKKHLSAEKLQIVMVTENAADLKEKLLSDTVPPLSYDGSKPQELLDEDRLIAGMKLGLTAPRITITPIDAVFAGKAKSPAHH